LNTVSKLKVYLNRQLML